MTMRRTFIKYITLAVAAVSVFAGGASNASAQSKGPGDVSIKGYVAPKPGEFPRLLFRESDLPRLKARAQTPEGKAIIARLKETLGGGEMMPENFSKDAPVNSADDKAVAKHPMGTYTLSHGAGFAFLYQLTGEKRYADLARQCLDKLFEGQVDRDSRYNWPTPGTGFRLGFVLQSICLTYDLAADAWPADYKKSVVERVMNMRVKKVDKDQFFTLEDLAKAGGYPPGSNHYGAYLSGPGLAALTFMGEPGADDKRLKALQEQVEKNLVNLCSNGFGDHGWFAEGTSCGRISSNHGVLPLLQSLKVAGGKDYISTWPNARFTVLRIMHEIVPMGGRAQFPHRGDYGNDNFYERPMISNMGDFSQGMGAVMPREAEAMAWIYDKFVEPNNKTYNSYQYPHLAIYAYVNWPEKRTDPDEVFAKTLVDDTHGYYLTRNGWNDGNDILVSTLLKRGPGGYKSGAVRAGTMVWGFGEKLNFGGLGGKTEHYRASADGSIELADEKGNALVVDFSKASGAAAVIAAKGDIKAGAPKKGALTVVDAGGEKVSVLVLNEAAPPAPTANGKTITIGGQTITLEGNVLKLTKFTEKK